MILDHYVWGDATRISPEAPVPVVDILRDTWTAGGAANVALNACSLGAATEMCGRIGDDEAGDQLMDLLARRGVTFDRGVFVADVPTIRKQRVFVQRQQLCRLDREAHPDAYGFGADEFEALLTKVRRAGVVIISDYAKGSVTADMYARLREATAAVNCLLALDPKPRGGLVFREPDLLTPNRKEALDLAGIESDPRDPFPAAAVCAAIWERYAPRHLVITMGEAGMLLSEDGRVSHEIPTVAREVFDVSGAGDTSVAALALALGAGFPLVEAARFANAAAGVVVGKVGTATATPDEILAHHE